MVDVKIDGGLPYATAVGQNDVIPVVQNGVTYAARAYMLAAQTGNRSAVSATPTGSYTLTANDAGNTVEVNSGPAATVTIPPASTVTWAAGTVINVFQVGSGQVTVTGGSGVTVQTPGGTPRTSTRYGNVRLRYRGNDTWAVNGDLG